MRYNKFKQKPTQINIETYLDIFSLITLLSKKYVFPNMPKRYLYEYVYREIEVGIKYGKGDKYPQRLYFFPNGFLGYSFANPDTIKGASTYNLEEILDYLDTPHQILGDFYFKLIKFSKERKKKIKGLRLALHLMKVILENEEFMN